MDEDMKAAVESAAEELKAMKGRSMPPAPPFIKLNNSEDAPISRELPKGKGLDILNMLNLKNLKIDGDTGLVLALLVLLGSENCDELLMLALLYIMI